MRPLAKIFAIVEFGFLTSGEIEITAKVAGNSILLVR